MVLKAGEKYGKELSSGIWIFKKDDMGNEYMQKTVRIYLNEKKGVPIEEAELVKQ